MRANIKMPLDALTQAQTTRRLELAVRYPHAQPQADGVPIGWIVAGILWTFAGLVWALERTQ